MPLRAFPRPSLAVTLALGLAALLWGAPASAQSSAVIRARAVHASHVMAQWSAAAPTRPAVSTGHAPRLAMVGLALGSPAVHSLWQGTIQRDLDPWIGIIGGFSRRRLNGYLGLTIRF